LQIEQELNISLLCNVKVKDPPHLSEIELRMVIKMLHKSKEFTTQSYHLLQVVLRFFVVPLMHHLGFASSFKTLWYSFTGQWHADRELLPLLRG